MRQMMTCAAALLVAACGTDATTDDAAAATGAASTGGDRASPAGSQSHDFAGTYEGQPQRDDLTAEITSVGPGRYKIGVTWGGMTAGGNYSSDGWEGTAKARGNVLLIEREDWDGTKTTCTMAFKGSGRASYTMTDCGGGDGAYRRVKATTAQSESSGGLSAADMRSIEEEGGAVGCSNSAVSGRAGRVLDRISANDDCDAPQSQKAGSVVGSGNEWLIGSWVDDPPACRGDSAISYSANGEYHASGDFGRWSMQGNKLNHVLLEQLEMGGSDTPVKVRNAKPVAWTIVKPGASKMTVRFPDSTTSTLFKCPE